MKFKMYTDKEGKVRWHLKAGNNRIIADSGEGYNGVGNCRRAIKMFKGGVDSAKVEEPDKLQAGEETGNE